MPWTRTSDGSRWFRIESAWFSMQGAASRQDFHDNSLKGDQFPHGSYLVQEAAAQYASGVTANDFPAWLEAHK